MKALKTPLAGKVLADPKAKEQLRQFLMSKRDLSTGQVVLNVGAIRVHDASGKISTVKPAIVRKAA